MGVKTGQYLLQLALKVKGQEWIDQNVHTLCCAGGPFLGSSQTVRSLVAGTRMGLPSSLLSNKDALLMVCFVGYCFRSNTLSLGTFFWIYPLATSIDFCRRNKLPSF